MHGPHPLTACDTGAASGGLRAGALVLAAGRGERMRPLTDHTPKPLLPVQGQPLMQWPMQALARSGVRQLVVNTAWLGEQISSHFGVQLSGTDFGTVSIVYSHEGRDFGGALETGGGIARALPWLDEVFWVVAGDVFAPDFCFAPEALARFRAGTALAHLWLVPNPAHHPTGDFALSAGGLALDTPAQAGDERFTFSTIALYRASFFAPPYCSIPPGNPQGVKAALAPMLRAAMRAGRVTAQLYQGAWTDVGTPQRLAQLNRPASTTA